MSIGSAASLSQDGLTSYYQTIEREVTAVPGVRVAALTTDAPLESQTSTQPFTVVGDAPIEQVFQTNAHYQIITPRYFEALGISLLQGRGFTDRDTSTAIPICIVNEELAPHCVRCDRTQARPSGLNENRLSSPAKS